MLAKGGALTTRALDAFRDCWRLTDLCVEDSPLVTQEWMAQLGGCLKSSAGMMRQLSFRRCPRIIDHDLCTLGQYCHLRSLVLDHCVNLSDDGLAHLSGMHQLRALSLEGCANITGRGFDSFKMLGRSLTQLNLNQLRSLSDGALEHISGFSELRVLRLGWCNRISDAGVFKLLPRPREGLHKLQSLSLDHTAISDAAADVLVGFDDLRVVRCVWN